MAAKYSKDAFIYVFARKLVGDLDQKDYIGEVQKIFSYVRDSIRYTRDVHNVETVQTPDWTLRIGTGDCDDKTLLFAALALSLGHQVKIRIVGDGGTEQYSHVYPLVFIPSIGWVAADGTEPERLGFKKDTRYVWETDCLSGALRKKKFVRRHIKRFGRRSRYRLNPISRQALIGLSAYEQQNLEGIFSGLKKKLKKIGKKVEKIAKKAAPLAIVGAAAYFGGPTGLAIGKKMFSAIKKKLPKSEQKALPSSPTAPAESFPVPQFVQEIRDMKENYDTTLSPQENVIAAQQRALTPYVTREIEGVGATPQQAQALAPIIIQGAAETGIREAVRETKAADSVFSNPVVLGAAVGVPLIMMMALSMSGGKK